MSSHRVNNGANKVDLNDIEMIFGTPNSPKGEVKPDVHLIANEINHTIDTHNNNNRTTDVDTETNSAQPLLEPDQEPPKPPLAGPEVDDLDLDHPGDATPFHGIDDGLLDPIDKHAPNGEGGGTETGDEHHPPLDGVGTDDGSDDGLKSKFDATAPSERPISPPPFTVDANTYQQKKNLAQGMMDLALLSANANQLRYVLEMSTTHPYYYPSLVFIFLSIVFQIAVGVGLILNSKYDVNDLYQICKANKVNNMTVVGVFLITILNVFITSFSGVTRVVVDSAPALAAPVAQAG
ncbi:uncharacterized protein NijA isoform X2 [Epargyreus clarus]|uniref:uncharacterized protein NijA isoform X2 n=1 Tax=Epargyreus clarus TaxID=520877 RepID=UPI003C3036FA